MAGNPYNGFPAGYRDKQGRKVYNGFRSGVLKRPIQCTVCNQHDFEGALIHAHNEDYHNPLNFVGICFPCHMAVHRRFKDIKRWYVWRERIASGWQPPKIRDYRVFIDIWNSLPDTPTGEIGEGWIWDLPDEEPDLYTGREPDAPDGALF